MDHADVVLIMLVGFRDMPIAQQLEPMLRGAGHPVLALRDARRMPPLLAEAPKVAIVVFDLGQSRAAELATAHEVHNRAAVVGVVEDADFGQYYALMNRGEIGYFEAQEPAFLLFSRVALAPRQARTV